MNNITPNGTEAENAPIRLWLDVDTGHDDAFALLLASRHPSLELLGVSTVFGNAPLPHTTHNTLAILTAIGRPDIPVYAGASRPFCREPAAAPDIHGESGLDGTTCLPQPACAVRRDQTAVEAMYRALMAQPAGSAWLVATGALTNVALLVALYPAVAAHLAGLSIMGGALGGDFSSITGNWSTWAEFNIYIDPESARAVFANPVLARKTTLIPLDLTHQFLATREVQRAMLYGFDGRGDEGGDDDDDDDDVSDNARQAAVPTVRRLFHEILIFFAKTYADVFGLVEGPPTHDPLAVAAIFAPHLFHDHGGERHAVRVVTDGEHGSESHVRRGDSQCGRTIATRLPSGTAGVRIPRSLEIDALWRMLEGCLGRTAQAVGQEK